jgi:hypothetical protein
LAEEVLVPRLHSLNEDQAHSNSVVAALDCKKAVQEAVLHTNREHHNSNVVVVVALVEGILCAVYSNRTCPSDVDNQISKEAKTWVASAAARATEAEAKASANLTKVVLVPPHSNSFSHHRPQV